MEREKGKEVTSPEPGEILIINSLKGEGHGKQHRKEYIDLFNEKNFVVSFQRKKRK